MPPPHIYTLSLHDALPILQVLDFLQEIPDVLRHGGGAQQHLRRVIALGRELRVANVRGLRLGIALQALEGVRLDRKSTRLNSSHITISYAVFCLKKKRVRH